MQFECIILTNAFKIKLGIGFYKKKGGGGNIPHITYMYILSNK